MSINSSAQMLSTNDFLSDGRPWATTMEVWALGAPAVVYTIGAPVWLSEFRPRLARTEAGAYPVLLALQGIIYNRDMPHC